VVYVPAEDYAEFIAAGASHIMNLLVKDYHIVFIGGDYPEVKFSILSTKDAAKLRDKEVEYIVGKAAKFTAQAQLNKLKRPNTLTKSLFVLLFSCAALFSRAQVSVTLDPTPADTLHLKPRFGAVATALTKDTAIIYLSGTGTADSRSAGQISYKWFQVSPLTPKGRFQKPDSIGTKVYGLPVGVYKFGFIITDKRILKSDTAYRTVTIKH
jgi:hypothetical protein